MGWLRGWQPLDHVPSPRRSDHHAGHNPPHHPEIPSPPLPRRRPTAWFGQVVVGLLVFLPAATGCYIAGWALAGPVFGVIVTLFWLVITLLVISMVRDL